MNKVAANLLLFASTWLLSCHSSKSVSVGDLKRIQDEKGFYSKSLYYCGSVPAQHYFEQEHPLEALLLPWPFSNDGVHRYKVRREELDLSSIQTFDRRQYSGQEDARRRKVRIKAPDPTTSRAEVKPRKEAVERFRVKHGNFDPARVKFVLVGRDKYRIEYE